jgi:hypothetical protein
MYAVMKTGMLRKDHNYKGPAACLRKACTSLAYSRDRKVRGTEQGLAITGVEREKNT